MILYYSGTGNSRYVAEKIASVCGSSLVNINEKIKSGDFRKIEGGGNLVFVSPVYAWRLPRLVKDWILHTEFSASKVWFIMTCGSEIGNAAKYNRLLCRAKHFDYMGTFQIKMPENYIALFDAPSPKVSEKIIAWAQPNIQKAGELIAAGKEFPAPRNSLYDRFMSGAVNPLFYSVIVKADGFYAKDSCISCGKCERSCPLNNIRLRDGKPVWGRNCTHCMACICGCPVEAIEYGNKSVGKFRYQCEAKDV